VHRLEHAGVAAGHIEVSAGGKADPTSDSRREVGEDVTEQIVSDDHVEPAGVGDQVDGGRIDVLVRHRHVGMLQRHLLHDARPQRTSV
jgi:hypothetical protein